jgi:hypothetical protein
MRWFALALTVVALCAPRIALAQGAAVAISESPTAEAPIEVADTESGITVRFRLLGAAPARGELVAGETVFPRALDDADLVRRPIDGGIEELVRFPVRPAREELDYDLDLTNVARVRAFEDVIEFCDGEGTPMLRVTAPWVRDAHGQDQTPAIALDGCSPALGPANPRTQAATVEPGTRCTLRVTWSVQAYPAELDPIWTTTKDHMQSARMDFAAVSGLTSGRVIVFGGYDGAHFLNTTEIYRPDLQRWSSGKRIGEVKPGEKAPGRRHLAAVTLDGTHVFVVGGSWCPHELPCSKAAIDAWLFDDDSARGNWTAMPAAIHPHAFATATVITKQGKTTEIWVAGDETVDVYGVSDAGQVTPAGSVELGSARLRHTATAVGGIECEHLYDAPECADEQHGPTLLICGGKSDDGRVHDSCLRWKGPELNSPKPWDVLTMLHPRHGHTATRLGSSESSTSAAVLIVGGDVEGNAELLEPSESATTFKPAGRMRESRYRHRAAKRSTSAHNRSVVISGGTRPSDHVPTPDAEGFVQDFTPGRSAWIDRGAMQYARSDHALIRVTSGLRAKHLLSDTLLAIGGRGGKPVTSATSASDVLATSEIFSPKSEFDLCTNDYECAEDICACTDAACTESRCCVKTKCKVCCGPGAHCGQGQDGGSDCLCDTNEGCPASRVCFKNECVEPVPAVSETVSCAIAKSRGATTLPLLAASAALGLLLARRKKIAPLGR